MIQLEELHVLDQDHDHDQCALCLLTVDQANDEYFLSTPEIEVPQHFVSPTILAFTNYGHSFIDSSFRHLPPNKAPPIS